MNYKNKIKWKSCRFHCYSYYTLTPNCIMDWNNVVQRSLFFFWSVTPTMVVKGGEDHESKSFFKAAKKNTHRDSRVRWPSGPHDHRAHNKVLQFSALTA